MQSLSGVRSFVVAAALAGLALLLWGTPALAATVQVTTSTDDNGAGVVCSLRAAVASVNADGNRGGCVASVIPDAYGTNDQITFAAGTDGSPILLANGPITITHNLQLVGNGAASTIVDGQKGTASATGVLQVNSGITVGISGLTIRNGSATDGAGINNFAALTVTNSILSGNSATSNTGGGGGIYNHDSLTLTNSTLSGNAVTSDTGGGGGIYSASGTLTVTNSTLSGNSVTSDSGGGGGIYSASGTLTVTNSTLSGNSAGHGLGGGIGNGGTLTITNSTISGNLAGRGAGIVNSGMLTIANSTISGNVGNVNSAAPGGGGIANQGTLTITNSTISGNSAHIEGGGVANQGTLTITNTTISGNLAPLLGGGISNQGTLTLTNSTLSGNSAPNGGGIYRNTGTVLLRAAVLDTGPLGANCAGSITSLGSNVADDTSCALTQTGDQQVADGAILLGPLANNGGPTQTHALLAGSPAIDAVQGLCTSDGLASGLGIATDQRGRSRPGGARCDAGAYEFLLGTLSFSAPAFTVSEGGGSAIVTVTRTGGSDGSVGATVSMADGTAVAPGDYTATTPTVSFADGDTASKTVSITIVDEALKEPNETVLLTLGAPTGGVAIGPQSSAVLTIVDNDPTPVVSIANVSVAEGNAGQASATFTVTLSNPNSQQITVAYATTNGTATAGTDYTATSGTLTFAPGVTSQPIAVPILGDTLLEPDETFTVTLSAPANAVIGTAQAIGTIQNDDVAVACTPRPRVTSSLQAGGGALTVHVEATPLNTQQNNRLQQLQFGALDNATVTMNGQPVAAGQTVTVPADTVGVTFTVHRTTAGRPATVFLTVVDGCGSWPTFVGGGTSAGF